MTNLKPEEIGSKTAKMGFRNEDDIVLRFNSWQNDCTAQEWLKIMNYDLEEIEYVQAIKVAGHKTDVQVQVTVKLRKVIDVQNLQVKLVSTPRGFNQIDKRWVDKYVELWGIPDDVSRLLKHYTGELKPYINNPNDKRRMKANEFSEEEKQRIISWLSDNKNLIISDILKGRGQLAAEWMLVAKKVLQESSWVLKSMNYCMNYFAKGDIIVSTRGTFKIGRITMQRKGGDAGRDTAKMLQFKINPAELFSDSGC